MSAEQRPAMWRHWGWVVCAAFVALRTVSMGVIYSYSQLLVTLSTELHRSMTLINWVGSVAMVIAYAGTPFSAYAHYKIGTMKSVLCGIVIASAGLVSSGFAENIWWLLLSYGLVTGCGMTMIINSPFILVAEYFPYDHPRHALATGAGTLAMPLGVLIFNPLCYLIISSIGWKLTFVTYGFVLAIVGIPLALTFRACPASQQKKSIEAELIRPISKTTTWTLGILWLLTSALKSWAYFAPLLILTKQMVTLGVSQSQAANAMALVGACEVTSRLLTSFLADYIKGKVIYMYIICMLGLAVQNVLGSMAHTFTQFALYGAGQGILGGPILAAAYSVSSEVMSGRKVPFVFSLFRVGLGIGFIAGPVIAGAIYDATGSFAPSFALHAVLYGLSSSLCAVIIYLNRARPSICFPRSREDEYLIESEL